MKNGVILRAVQEILNICQGILEGYDDCEVENREVDLSDSSDFRFLYDSDYTAQVVKLARQMHEETKGWY